MPRPAEQVRAELQAAALGYGTEPMAAEVRWNVIRCLELPWHGLPVAQRRDNRYLICLYLFGWASTKSLSDAHILALVDWMHRPLADALTELHAVLKAARLEQGQAEMELKP